MTTATPAARLRTRQDALDTSSPGLSPTPRRAVTAAMAKMMIPAAFHPSVAHSKENPQPTSVWRECSSIAGVLIQVVTEKACDTLLWPLASTAVL
jgi:hypothetical protein